MNKYDRSILLICPVCGNSQFEMLNEYKNPSYRCSDCSNIFTKEQLLSENEENIEANKNEMVEEYLVDFEKDLQKKLKKLFR